MHGRAGRQDHARHRGSDCRAARRSVRQAAGRLVLGDQGRAGRGPPHGEARDRPGHQAPGQRAPDRAAERQRDRLLLAGRDAQQLPAVRSDRGRRRAQGGELPDRLRGHPERVPARAPGRRLVPVRRLRQAQRLLPPLPARPGRRGLVLLAVRLLLQPVPARRDQSLRARGARPGVSPAFRCRVPGRGHRAQRRAQGDQAQRDLPRVVRAPGSGRP
ncbi:hypothetical protein D3C81_1567860 [compost metagenome]